ncbi:hypothetical protein [Arthrobacter mobilis]|uniref:Anti-sigma-D factor RsdA to sigma factor binding region n=1 Tax=Arthrobacter mobilis TaxID=2724944 RepID=A0A7X6HAJ5_9MICC|nr:hypothetical protein [Arthrobacter mobilis]NKX53070.1 hypothetical protein [Arthrobacter mobilis]
MNTVPHLTRDDDVIGRLLDESGVDPSPALRASLLELRTAGTGPAPAPSAELAAFLAPATSPPRPRRRLAKGAMIGLAAAAATGLGVSGVAAANPQFPETTGHVVRQVIGFFDPAPGGVPAPQAPEEPAVPSGGTTGQAEPASPAAGTSGSGTPGPAHSPGGGSKGKPAADRSGAKDSAHRPGHRAPDPAGALPLPGVPAPPAVPGRDGGRPGGQGSGAAAPDSTGPGRPAPDGSVPGRPDLKLPPGPGRPGSADLPAVPALPGAASGR